MRRWWWEIVSRTSQYYPEIPAFSAIFLQFGILALDFLAHVLPWKVRLISILENSWVRIAVVATDFAGVALLLTMEYWLFPWLYQRSVRRLSKRLTQTQAWGKNGATVTLSMEKNQVFLHVNDTRRQLALQPKSLALLHWMVAISGEPFLVHRYTLARVLSGSAHQRLAAYPQKRRA